MAGYCDIVVLLTGYCGRVLLQGIVTGYCGRVCGIAGYCGRVL